MSLAEDYLVLGLRLGKHVDGLVDAYYGPPELREQVDAEEIAEAAVLVDHASSLVGRAEDGWLRDQLIGCATYARVLAGEQISYADEVERCYGVRPAKTPVSVYEAAHAELDTLLPGDGTLGDRRQAWRTEHQVEGSRAVPVLRDLLPVLRELTSEIVELPDGESLTVDEVRDEPWWAFNYYQGHLQSRVVVNLDVPTTGFDLIRLAAHEVYPGHHTEHAVKEHLLLRGEQRIEEGIQLVPTPQALLSEGIAESGLRIVLANGGHEAVCAVLREHGIEYDLESTMRIVTALDSLGWASVDAALMIHEDGVSTDEVEDYLIDWRLATREQAKQTVRFVTDPTWRAYAITYAAGEELCDAYTGGDRRRFHTLLTQHVRVSDLLAPAG